MRVIYAGAMRCDIYFVYARNIVSIVASASGGHVLIMSVTMVSSTSLSDSVHVFVKPDEMIRIERNVSRMVYPSA